MTTRRSPKLLIAAAALLGLTGSQVAQKIAALESSRSEARQNDNRQSPAVADGTTARELTSDAFGGYGASLLNALRRDRGHTPYEWGTSRACAKMVRQNRMNRLGIRQSRI